MKISQQAAGWAKQWLDCEGLQIQELCFFLLFLYLMKAFTAEMSYYCKWLHLFSCMKYSTSPLIIWIHSNEPSLYHITSWRPYTLSINCLTHIASSFCVCHTCTLMHESVRVCRDNTYIVNVLLSYWLWMPTNNTMQQQAWTHKRSLRKCAATLKRGIVEQLL